MKIYRVRIMSQLDADCDRSSGLSNMPGGNCTATGFWSTDIGCANALLAERNNSAYNSCGGGSWARIVTTDLSNVVTKDDFSKFKTNNNDEYDKGEIFVTEIINSDAVETMIN